MFRRRSTAVVDIFVPILLSSAIFLILAVLSLIIHPSLGVSFTFKCVILIMI